MYLRSVRRRESDAHDVVSTVLTIKLMRLMRCSVSRLYKTKSNEHIYGIVKAQHQSPCSHHAYHLALRWHRPATHKHPIYEAIFRVSIYACVDLSRMFY